MISALDREVNFNYSETLRRVIHDIRSPLSSLIMIMEYSTNLPMSEKERLSNSIARIKRIVDSAGNMMAPKKIIDIKENVMITIIIENIIREKEIEFANQNIKFLYNVSAKCKDARMSCYVDDFQRMLSNLINNAVESYKGLAGTVNIKLLKRNNLLTLVVEDNGCGISKDILNKLRNSTTVTYGKEFGQGIGMNQIRDTLLKLNAQLEIKSKLSCGSKFLIIFKS